MESILNNLGKSFDRNKKPKDQFKPANKMKEAGTKYNIPDEKPETISTGGLMSSSSIGFDKLSRLSSKSRGSNSASSANTSVSSLSGLRSNSSMLFGFSTSTSSLSSRFGAGLSNTNSNNSNNSDFRRNNFMIWTGEQFEDCNDFESFERLDLANKDKLKKLL
eukprot:Pgem_evm1s6082